MSLTARLEAAIAAFSGTCGLAALNFTTGEAVTAGAAGQPFTPASTVKLPVLFEVFRQAEAGLLSLDEPLVLTAADQVQGSGVLRDLTLGLTLSVRDVATLMITVSDNSATNMCIGRVGTAAVNATAGALGLTHTVLNRKINRETDRPLGSVSPADLLRFFHLLWRGAAGAAGFPPAAAVSPTGCAAMLDILGRQQFTFLTREIPDFWPQSGDAQARFAGKSGWVPGTRNDAGIIWAPRATYAVAICTAGCQDLRYHPDNEGALLLNRLSGLLYAAWGAA